MPLCTLHLISLNPKTTIPQFVSSIVSQNVEYLTLSHVIRWIITPSQIDKDRLLTPSPSEHYDLLLIVPGTSSLPGPLEAQTSSTYTLQVGIPSRLLKDFPSRNQKLLHPASDSVPKLTGSLSDPIVDPKSSQTLTLSPDLQAWVKEFSKTKTGSNAMSMMNLLAFHLDKKDSYLKYGKAFAETIGSKRGGDAKLVGHVVYSSPSPSSSSSSDSSASPPSNSVFPDLDKDASSQEPKGKSSSSSPPSNDVFPDLDKDAETHNPQKETNPSQSSPPSNDVFSDLDKDADQTSQETSQSSSSSTPPSNSVFPDLESSSTSTKPKSTSQTSTSSPRWDEFALAHYPSITHFADMLASKDYQEVNQKYRVPALRDTCILCTSEIDVEEMLAKEGKKNGKAKL